MVIVAQLVRAPDCGSGGRRFEPGHSPIIRVNGFLSHWLFFFCAKLVQWRIIRVTNDEYGAWPLNFEERSQFVIRHSNNSSFYFKLPN